MNNDQSTDYTHWVSSAPAKKSIRHKVTQFLLGVGFLLVLLLPGVLIGVFLVSGAASILLFGALPVAVAYFGGATSATPRIIAVMVVSGTLARVFDQSPILSALLVAVVAFLIGISARRGLSSPILFVGISLAFLVINPPKLGQSGQQVFDNLDPVLVTALLLLIGGLWARLVIASIRKWIPATPETSPRSMKILVPYGLALGISTGLSTYFLMTYAPGGVGAWLILTIFVVYKPDPDKRRARTRDRVIGTIGGGIAAFIVLEILEAFDWQQGLAQLLLALLFLGVSMTYFIPGPYWKYVFFLTPGVVLLDSNAVSDQTNIDLLRVVYTLIGVAIALISGLVVQLVVQTIYGNKATTPDQSH
jgi:hypothetical protein